MIIKQISLCFIVLPLLFGCGPSASEIAKMKAEEEARIQLEKQKIEQEHRNLIANLGKLSDDSLLDLLSNCRSKAKSDMTKKHNYVTHIDKETSADIYVYMAERSALESDLLRIENFREKLKNIDNDPDIYSLKSWLEESLNTNYALLDSSSYGQTVEHRLCFLKSTEHGVDISFTIGRNVKLIR